VAESFARAWGAWRKVRQHPARQAWIVRTALNTHVSWWRRRRREISRASPDDRAAASPQLALDSSLVAALRRLPARQRQVIALRLLLDLDTAGLAPGASSWMELLGGPGPIGDWSWVITPGKIPPGGHFVISAVPRPVPANEVQIAWEFAKTSAPLVCATHWKA
jgi:hypothetical protein